MIITHPTIGSFDDAAPFNLGVIIANERENARENAREKANAKKWKNAKSMEAKDQFQGNISYIRVYFTY